MKRYGAGVSPGTAIREIPGMKFCVDKEELSSLEVVTGEVLQKFIYYAILDCDCADFLFIVTIFSKKEMGIKIIQIKKIKNILF